MKKEKKTNTTPTMSVLIIPALITEEYLMTSYLMSS